VYALTASLFFVALVAFVGTRWMANAPGAGGRPTALALAQAFAGLFVLSLMFGLFYSAVISFFLAKRQSETSHDRT
jgi:hypothetical protein